jgi:hypothetical protein
LETTVDLAAVGRVAKRVELKGVRLAEISAKCDPKVEGPLKPTVNLDCKIGDHDANTIEVVCNYTFVAHSEQLQAIESAIKYLLLYEISSPEAPPSDNDLAEFAKANGALHSWPFVREVLFGLTSRMGYPPYTLPVMHFNQKPQPAAPKKTATPTPAETSKVTEKV